MDAVFVGALALLVGLLFVYLVYALLNPEAF